jgi:hypothetical protein
MYRGVVFRLLLCKPLEVECFFEYDFALHLIVGGESWGEASAH